MALSIAARLLGVLQRQRVYFTEGLTASYAGPLVCIEAELSSEEYPSTSEWLPFLEKSGRFPVEVAIRFACRGEMLKPTMHIVMRWPLTWGEEVPTVERPRFESFPVTMDQLNQLSAFELRKRAKTEAESIARAVKEGAFKKDLTRGVFHGTTASWEKVLSPWFHLVKHFLPGPMALKLTPHRDDNHAFPVFPLKAIEFSWPIEESVPCSPGV